MVTTRFSRHSDSAPARCRSSFTETCKSSAGASPPRRSQFRMASAMVASISMRSRSSSPVSGQPSGHAEDPALHQSVLQTSQVATVPGGKKHPRAVLGGRRRFRFHHDADGPQDISYWRALSLDFFGTLGLQVPKVACLHFLNKKSLKYFAGLSEMTSTLLEVGPGGFGGSRRFQLDKRT